MITGNNDRILSNIALARENIAKSANAKTVVMVTSTDEDRARWQKRLEDTSPYIFNRDGGTFVLSLREKIGGKLRTGNFLGTLLAYSRLKEVAAASGKDIRDTVSLMGMILGRGERISPFTQIEGNSKPAIISSAPRIPEIKKRILVTEVEEALMYFSPVAKYLEKGGFRGVLNKWGDETQIPSIDISEDPDKDSFSYDIIKFVSVVKMTDELAEQKDWVVFDGDDNIVAQLSRNKKSVLIKELKQYEGRGTKDEGQRMSGVSPAFAKATAGKRPTSHVPRPTSHGISLGPVAVSYDFLDIALEVFDNDIKKEGVSLDFDPYLIAAFAVDGDIEKWDDLLRSDPAMRFVAGPKGMIPDLFEKAGKIKDVFKEKKGRDLRMKVIDLGEGIFWADIGQHKAMREKYLALADDGPTGTVTREIERVPHVRDNNGNIIVDSHIGPSVDIKDSVVIGSTVNSGKIRKSVIKESVLGEVDMNGAFAVLCYRAGRTILKTGSGIYRSLGKAAETLVLDKGMRHGTFISHAGHFDMKVSEDTDLRDRKKNYETPVFGNKLSFRDAYEMMAGVSERELEELRRSYIDEIKHSK